MAMRLRPGEATLNAILRPVGHGQLLATEGIPIDASQIRLRHLLVAAYPIAAALILAPLLDTFTRTWPPRFTEVGWRFGTAGIMLNALVTPLLGVFVLLVAGALREQRLFVRILSIICYVLAGLLLLGVGLFVLDFLQVRSEIAPDNQGAFAAPTVKAILVGVLGIVAAAWMGWGGDRATRKRRH